ncbi:MAG: hypothetical protein JO112_10420, partial [Planctomycetes bacterium]|nr:hypothetical protein [Planctomycetota bacterium]
FGPLTPPALPLALVLVLLGAGTARAHRLNAQAFVLPDQKVQIESWFSNNDVPHGAQVQVFRPDGQLLTEGTLNDQGIFVFSYERPEALRVVVSAGAGHRKELVIPEADLVRTAAAQAPASSSTGQADSPEVHPVPLADRSSGISIKDVLVGVGFLLALAAFVLSLRNARQLRKFREEMPPSPPQA